MKKNINCTDEMEKCDENKKKCCCHEHEHLNEHENEHGEHSHNGHSHEHGHNHEHEGKELSTKGLILAATLYICGIIVEHLPIDSWFGISQTVH